jgi:hypothetical protein
MATVAPEMLAQEIRLIFERMGLGLSARATPALRFRQWVELEDGKRGSAVVETPAVLVGDKIAIRVEKDHYRVYNLASTPYHGLFHQGVCKTTNARHAIQAAVMAAIHEHFTGLFQEHEFGALEDG